jgi:hypothetical protein
MTLYGDVDQVKKMLRPTEASSFGADADARLTELRKVVSLALEEKTGRVFGGSAVATARTVDGPPAAPSDVLLLPAPVRSVASVAFVGDAPQTLPSTDYVLWNVGRTGDAHALLRIANGWWPARDGVNRIVVTGVWSDEAPGGAVPDDVTYVANYLIAELFKAEQASPAGFTGPDGATVPIRDPWKNELVKTVVGKYGARRIVGF